MQVKVDEFKEQVNKDIVEYNIMSGLEDIFSPRTVSNLADDTLKRLAGEPSDIAAERNAAESKVRKLEEGQKILSNVVGIEMSPASIQSR